MSGIEKVATLIVGVALVTTLILPGRQTAAVLTAGGNVFSNAIKTAQGR
jgi:hypothetical protein